MRVSGKWLSAKVALTLLIGGTLLTLNDLKTPRNRGELVQRLWQEDFQKLHAANALPRELFDVQAVTILTPPSNETYWINQLQWPGPTSPQGKHRVEILLLEWDEAGQSGVIIQTNLYDTNGNNMIWELGRTFVLGTISSTPDPKSSNTQ